jgi:hypothetical protein
LQQVQKVLCWPILCVSENTCYQAIELWTMKMLVIFYSIWCYVVWALFMVSFCLKSHIFQWVPTYHLHTHRHIQRKNHLIAGVLWAFKCNYCFGDSGLWFLGTSFLDQHAAIPKPLLSRILITHQCSVDFPDEKFPNQFKHHFKKKELVVYRKIFSLPAVRKKT